ncbi:ABC transporter permease [Halocatena pleomorpha]|uniref:ABC transporter permease n=1 Tax=Halocatena pleomorpha TaxID=1785090 RepID=A0A3P3RDB6_9EURY|nr:ABC transporter permease [Halocatena pleomorpha]RRJ31456.1 ABC transporter permease [Halocatena pleomorpha]
MDERSASLLTKTQRQRLQNEFADVDTAAKQRDQRLIRQRIQAGVLDFRLLTTYPDRQYDLAFDDVSEEELRLALADTYVAAERLRVLQQYDRDQLLREARRRAETVSAQADDVRSLDRLTLQTAPEIRQQTEERLGVSRWVRRARIGIILGNCGLFASIVPYTLLGGFVGRVPAVPSLMLGGSAIAAGLLVGLSMMMIIGHELFAILTAGKTLMNRIQAWW